MYPERYPSDDMRLSYGAALSLNVSAYFNPGADAMDGSGTDLMIRTGGEVAPVDGLLHIDFTAADEDGLAAALLQRGGDTLSEMPLSGARVDAVFATPYYTPGTEGSYSIAVLDAFGNRHQGSFSVTASQGYNRGRSRRSRYFIPIRRSANRSPWMHRPALTRTIPPLCCWSNGTWMETARSTRRRPRRKRTPSSPPSRARGWSRRGSRILTAPKRWRRRWPCGSIR